ncbi:MAG TPA: alginate export family protein [Candidatus Hydrogenedentes bacterium]|nr:alginate export family protein [Candidatus Hydrogenedentota bacterium]
MSRKMLCLVGLALVCAATPALAELNQVEVGGSLRLRFNYISNQLAVPAPTIQHGPLATLGRPIGGPFHPAVGSIMDWDDAGPDYSAVEQRTRLHVKATFTEDVSAFVEFDSYDVWGEDFRSNYLTGADARDGDNAADINLYQAYVDVKGMWGTPLSLRVGRQELAFGSQWLVGPRDFAFLYTGLSFDALRLTYAGESFTVDAWASKLAETMGSFGQDDVDFYGVYASCTAVENHTFDVYWMLVNDDTMGTADTLLNTVGVRGAGRMGAFDYDAEVAYQFGSADAYGLVVGDTDADFDNWGAKLDLGYAFDCAWTPRLFVSGRYYGGEDNRQFGSDDASVNFNRLFSNEIVTGFIDLLNDLSNAWTGRVGVMCAPMPKIRTVFAVSYYEALEPFDRPGFLWWTDSGDTDLGWEVTLFNEYHYSEDLVFEFGWTHLFTGDGLGESNFSAWNGTISLGGSDDDDADYAYAGCRISF